MIKKPHQAGLGYEECNEIMMHDPNAYDDDGRALHKEQLIKVIDKYLFFVEG